MPQVKIDSTKGLFQTSGLGLVGVPAQLNTLSAGVNTITIDGFVVRLDAGGSARNESIISTSGAVAGQIAILVNEGGEEIAFDAVATSNLFGSAATTTNALAAGAAMLIVYDDTNSRWVTPSPAAVLGNAAN